MISGAWTRIFSSRTTKRDPDCQNPDQLCMTKPAPSGSGRTALLPFSVIIPARNAAGTLACCLGAVFASSLKPPEVLVVDDGSVDETSAIAARYPCRVIPIALGSGPMAPRYAGAARARGQILVFIDADVEVRPDTFSRLIADFSDPAVHAVTGCLSPEGPVTRFAGHFKNEYMHWIFSRQPRRSSFLYGSLWAVRREDLIVFEPVSEPFGSLVSDSEMGFRLQAAGKGVILDHNLVVGHHKNYSLAGLLKNDFVIPFMFARIFFRYRNASSWTCRKAFSHASLAQGLSVFAAPAALVLFSLFVFSGSCLYGVPAVLMLTGFYAFWFSFLAGLLKRRGILFVLRSLLVLPLDAAVMAAGICGGLVYSLKKAFSEGLFTDNEGVLCPGK